MSEIIVAFASFAILVFVGKYLSRIVSSFSTEGILGAIYFVLFMIFSVLLILAINVLKYIYIL